VGVDGEDAMKQPHTACHRGKRVLVRLRDGTLIDDRFVDRTDRWVVLEKAGKVMKERIKAFIILKVREGVP